MKKIILFLSLVMIFTNGFAQSDSAKGETSFYGLVEINPSTPDSKFGQDHYEEIQLSFRGKSGFGVYVNYSHQPEFNTLGAGILYGKPGNFDRWYSEIALAYTAEFEKDIPTGSAIDSYWYFVSKAQQDRAPGKVELLINPYYSFTYGWWYRAVATYSVVDALSVGIYSKKDVLTGPCVQLNFGLFKKLNTQFLIATSKDQTLFGLTINTIL